MGSGLSGRTPRASQPSPRRCEQRAVVMRCAISSAYRITGARKTRRSQVLFLLTQQAHSRPTDQFARQYLPKDATVAGQQRMSVRRDRSRRAAFYRLVVVAESRGPITAFALAWRTRSFTLAILANSGTFGNEWIRCALWRDCWSFVPKWRSKRALADNVKLRGHEIETCGGNVEATFIARRTAVDVVITDPITTFSEDLAFSGRNCTSCGPAPS